MTFTGNPRDHPDNANLPNLNQPGTIIGVTVTFLVRCRVLPFGLLEHD